MLETVIAATIQALPTHTPLPQPSETPLLRATRLPPTEIFTPTLSVSITPFPTFTMTPTLTETATEVGVASRQGIYQGSGNYACMVMDQRPINFTKFKPGTLVYATWTVKNVGAKEWTKGGLNIVYSSGTKINEYAPSQPLSFTVKPGETREIVIVIRAPDKGGDYQTIFALERGGNEFCEFILGVSVR
ncbi:MAG: NBR1-Ig-like domain-containing protein [Anaerolineales bacterium]|nr:NBR1-Ig-like domain-containing protein [Anaerolineales bacterium]